MNKLPLPPSLTCALFFQPSTVRCGQLRFLRPRRCRCAVIAPQDLATQNSNPMHAPDFPILPRTRNGSKPLKTTGACATAAAPTTARSWCSATAWAATAPTAPASPPPSAGSAPGRGSSGEPESSPRGRPPAATRSSCAPRSKPLRGAAGTGRRRRQPPPLGAGRASRRGEGRPRRRGRRGPRAGGGNGLWRWRASGGGGGGASAVARRPASAPEKEAGGAGRRRGRLWSGGWSCSGSAGPSESCFGRGGERWRRPRWWQCSRRGRGVRLRGRVMGETGTRAGDGGAFLVTAPLGGTS